MPLTETDLDQIEEIPAEEISGNLPVTEGDLQIKNTDVKKSYPDPVKVRVNGTPNG